MQAVEKFDTLMTRMYQFEYKPSECLINPFAQVVEHKTRPRLEEVHLRNRYRRTLSALLRSKPVPSIQDKTHASLNTLHRYENGLQGKVSAAAPTKDHQKYAALRQGRDPRMNEPNAHFDRLEKENQGFNVGRHERERPNTAVLAWRPRNPFLTYEKATLNDAQLYELENKKLHAKIMDDRVQIYNQQFVPDDLLPSDCGWKREKSQREAKKRRSSSADDYPPMPKNQHCIAHDHSKDKRQQKFKSKRKTKQTIGNEDNNQGVDGRQVQAGNVLEGQKGDQLQIVDINHDDKENQNNQNAEKNAADNSQKRPGDAEEDSDDDKERMPAQILEEMRKSNIKDIIRNMTVHEQLRMIRNVMDDEEFKRKQKLREIRLQRQEQEKIKQEEEKASREATELQRQSNLQEQRQREKQRAQINKDLDGVKDDQNCTCSKKRLDDMTYDELVNQKPADVVEAEEVDCDGPLPLTEQNLSAMNNESATRGWNVVSAVEPPRQGRQAISEIIETHNNQVNKNNKQNHKQLQFRNTAIDINKVNEKKESDRRLQQLGWQKPKQMDPAEIQRRQSAAEQIDQNGDLAKKVYDIVQRNQLVKTTIPPVPRLVMGNHGKKI